jgi:hypothetical protein
MNKRVFLTKTAKDKGSQPPYKRAHRVLTGFYPIPFSVIPHEVPRRAGRRCGTQLKPFPFNNPDPCFGQNKENSTGPRICAMLAHRFVRDDKGGAMLTHRFACHVKLDLSGVVRRTKTEGRGRGAGLTAEGRTAHGKNQQVRS